MAVFGIYQIVCSVDTRSHSGRGYRQSQVPVRKMGELGDVAKFKEILEKMMEEHHQREKKIATEKGKV